MEGVEEPLDREVFPYMKNSFFGWWALDTREHKIFMLICVFAFMNFLFIQEKKPFHKSFDVKRKFSNFLEILEHNVHFVISRWYARKKKIIMSDMASWEEKIIEKIVFHVNSKKKLQATGNMPYYTANYLLIFQFSSSYFFVLYVPSQTSQFRLTLFYDSLIHLRNNSELHESSFIQ
jgi:hypothetical protein